MNKRFEQKVVTYLLPHLLRILIVNGHLKSEMLGKVELISSIFRKHLYVASKSFSCVISLHEEFAEDSFRLWDKGRRYPALVLFATAVEQALNSHYRLAFLATGISNKEITAIIRSHNLDAKLTWLMNLATKTAFPKPLAKRLKSIFEIRNSIVHYKAIPGHPDQGDDSHEVIERSFKQLGKISLRRDFSLLNNFLDTVLMQHDPTFALAHEMANQILTLENSALMAQDVAFRAR